MLLLKMLYNGITEHLQNFRIDARLTTNPVLGSPWFMALTILFYVLAVKEFGPRFMANRKAYNVDGLMQVYNVIQILLNSFICYEFLRYTVLNPDYSLTCEGYNPEDRRPMKMKIVRPVTLYYISKYLDWFDTIFFLLRKKNRQITFLHIYHHAIMVFGTYVYSAAYFAAHPTSTGLVNSFIHVVMYFYYMVSAQKPNIDLEPWKKLLTRMQLTQFVILAVHMFLPLYNNWCNLKLFWLWVAFLQDCFMIALFSDFYYKTYIRRDKRKKIQ
ncbi:very long chain fatty acid elongase F-like [Haematobia irritans]|uniref:very long chain fatty acid elongase F-like n=1 Tax=Haematobia irritans TaxID=7368 RepID=UPI003F505CE0